MGPFLEGARHFKGPPQAVHVEYPRLYLITDS